MQFQDQADIEGLAVLRWNERKACEKDMFLFVEFFFEFYSAIFFLA